MHRGRRSIACAALFAVGRVRRRATAAASGGGGAKATPASRCPTCRWRRRVGAGEGKLNIIAWAGYAEDGSTDPKRRLGHAVREGDRLPGQRQDRQHLRRDGHADAHRQYDGVSASGDASLRLIAGGDVAPVNTKLVPNYADIVPQLKNQAYNSVERPDVRHPARLGRQPADVATRTRSRRRRTRWGAVFDQSSPYKGKVTAYDDPIYIADAALYLQDDQARPEDHEPLRARPEAVRRGGRLLKKQRQLIGEYWSDYTKEQAAFTQRRLDGRHDLAGHRQPARRPTRSAGQDDPAEGGRDRLVGHLDDRRPRPSTRTACTSG